MNPAVLNLIISFVELAIKEAPAIRAELQAILSKNNPTPDDWLNLKAKIQLQTFESLAPDAKTS